MTTGEWFSNVIAPLLVLATAWLAPALSGPTLPFGVRVPAAYTDAPVIARQRGAYRLLLGGAGAVLVLAGAGLTLAGPHGGYGALPSLLALALCLAGYLRARRAIRAVKQREGWFQGLRQTVAVDTSLRTDPERFPWLWAAPALLVLVVTAVTGVVRYPSMPDRLPTHYQGAGTADHFAAKTLGSAFAPVVAQAALTAILLLLMWLTFRSRADLDPARPAATAYQHRRFLGRMAVAMLLLAACIDLTLLAAAWQIWHGDRTLSLTPLLVPALAGAGLVIGTAVLSGQNGGRIPVPEGVTNGTAAPDTGAVHHDDDRYWRAGGLFYANRQDPALLVPKRFGIGWTVNLGNPRTLLLVVLIAGFPLAMDLLTR
ncbi:DUF5808 domain-containing protein [Kitasatospora kazusensis]|uniref:DUF5808 domain-containing protein n=1 Tax=Kitasatospora kazusensis TaxID=407974 RepID=A0ABP5LTQ5_9ACTN